MERIENRTEQQVEVVEICLNGAEELGRALTTILQSAQNVRMVSEILPAGDSQRRILEDLLAKTQPNLLLLCVLGRQMRQVDKIFDSIRKAAAEVSVIAIVDGAGPTELDHLLNMGAADFCLAPLRLEELLPRIVRWSCWASSREQVATQLGNKLGLQKFLGVSPAFLEVIRRIPKLAQCDGSVFINGETGTGKEMCARAIHHLGPRADHPFIPLNCGAIPSELVENELFGHDVGAFTGASAAAHGLIHDAEGGTLFLDEIDAMSLQMQVKFLRFVQDREYRALGGRKVRRADVRIMAASNANLRELLREGRFRSDLFYRLNVLPITLPALRERKVDIPLLARHFAAKYSAGIWPTPKEMSKSAMEKLVSYAWPGNVRELENTIERAVLLSEHPIITNHDVCLPTPDQLPGETSFKAQKAQAIAQFESEFIQRALSANGGNISKAARSAQKNRRAFWQLMRKHGIAAAALRSRGAGQTAAQARTFLS